ncbi:hypothetical protein DICSQDRAFT_133621 [Dichomitus squalens LYAD-421 SS1]|uniref:Uncharacterized protein n=1 Tax=Dichomitus squalens TaxID=114155 RepID=A0A4Q9MM70_9APHY|nr:uncharacterized protein DICSQDRAFT_133621 [Dichomitus squalens LYAD-421 SS1]EJF64912.1 hypothetical protein DICSQDRAFT_133621 [Dichomitus squalens LYAD-421 SS1]TBU28167.1 hypothetical protein BD311DRAFT_663878 [Dichomitus squalens]TBU54998.1 hypothetical protein BD310DRAFT_951064 [Dichomitus squalens]
MVTSDESPAEAELYQQEREIRTVVNSLWLNTFNGASGLSLSPPTTTAFAPSFCAYLAFLTEGQTPR